MFVPGLSFNMSFLKKPFKFLSAKEYLQPHFCSILWTIKYQCNHCTNNKIHQILKINSIYRQFCMKHKLTKKESKAFNQLSIMFLSSLTVPAMVTMMQDWFPWVTVQFPLSARKSSGTGISAFTSPATSPVTRSMLAIIAFILKEVASFEIVNTY